MNDKELSRLIKRFYDGESSEEEEKLLRAFFSGDDIPDGFETEKDIFRFYLESGNMTEPLPGFEKRIDQVIRRSDRRRITEKVRTYLLPLVSAAAVIFIMTVTYFFLDDNRIKDTYSDPEVAYTEAMRILMDVSARLNKGRSSLEPVAKLNEMTAMSFKSLNRSSAIVKKSINKLNLLEKDIDFSNLSDTGITKK